MKSLIPAIVLVCAAGFALAQAPAEKKPAAATPDDISGMYTFLREGEYLQLTVEDEGKITGVLSRFGDQESDRGAFLDQFLDKGLLQNDRLTFTTRAVHGVWYEFKGKVERASDKAPGAEGYHVLRGKLTQYTTDANKHTSAKSRDVELKSFPADVNGPGSRD